MSLSKKILIALLFIITGAVIMVVFSPWQPLLEKSSDYPGRIGLVTLLALSTWQSRRRGINDRVVKLITGLFIMALAISLDWVFANYLINSVGISDNTPKGFALLKLNECFIIVVTIITFTQITGESLASLYLQKGRLKTGLLIGSAIFVLAAAGAIPAASFMFGGDNLQLSVIIPWIPWILIFIFANATMEELLFRGLFLQKLEPFFGKFLSNFLIAFVFTGLHLFATYTTDQYLFVAILFPLALLWGYLIQKTEGLWASILFHAGMDIPIILGMLSSLQQ
jgi:membrane protease YdiL (CAAX protease family)